MIIYKKLNACIIQADNLSLALAQKNLHYHYKYSDISIYCMLLSCGTTLCWSKVGGELPFTGLPLITLNRNKKTGHHIADKLMLITNSQRLFL